MSQAVELRPHPRRLYRYLDIGDYDPGLVQLRKEKTLSLVRSQAPQPTELFTANGFLYSRSTAVP